MTNEHNIESQFNACMHKEYCLSLKAGQIRPLDENALAHTINMMPWRTDDLGPKLREFAVQLWLQFCSVPTCKESLKVAPAPAVPQIKYHPGTWYEVKSHEELEAFFLSRLPSIREAAREHGYAIGLHGSLRRDMDLIAVPWRDGASDKDKLAHAIAMAAVGMTRNGGYQWEAKPCGRVATSLSCCWTPWPDVPGSGQIDLSVMETKTLEPFGYFRPEPFGWTDCAADEEGAVALYEATPDVASLRKELESANDFIKSLADVFQKYEELLGYRKTNAPEGASELAEAKGESSLNTELDLACANSTCQHDFALDPKSSILICLKCGTPERRAMKTAAPSQPVTLKANLERLASLASITPELNLSNYGPDDVEELNAWAIEVSLAIDDLIAALREKEGK